MKVPRPVKGERVFFLEVPYEERTLAASAGAEWFPGIGWAYVGATLPESLRRWRPLRYSLSEFMEEEHLGHHAAAFSAPKPDPTTGTITLKPEQVQDVRDLMIARRDGAPGFLNGSDLGYGKTVVTIAAVKRMANVKNVLVVGTLSSLATWRIHLGIMGDGGKNWCLVNYESARRLLELSARDNNLKRKSTQNEALAKRGIPRFSWDVVIADESHRLGNLTSQQTRIVDRVIAGPPGAHLAFQVWLSATAGKDPSKLGYLHRSLFKQTGYKVLPTINPSTYTEWCEKQGFTLKPSMFEQQQMKWVGTSGELRHLNSIIYGPQNDPKWSVRRRNPQQWQRIPFPIELSYHERIAYETEWKQFQQAVDRLRKAEAAAAAPGASKAQKTAARDARANTLAQKTRYRQKAGVLRAPASAAAIADFVEKGYQVAASCQYTATTVPKLLEELTRRGIPTTTFTGENTATREDNRIGFQRGDYKVILFTTTESINLHAGDTAVGGNTVPRVTYVAEPRWSAYETRQIEGRAQRNGTTAPIYYPYAVGTIEETVLRTGITGMGNLAIINGDDETPFAGLHIAMETTAPSPSTGEHA